VAAAGLRVVIGACSTVPTDHPLMATLLEVPSTESVHTMMGSTSGITMSGGRMVAGISDSIRVVQLNRLARTAIAAAALTCAFGGTATAVAPASASASVAPASALFSFADPRITESSGLAASSTGRDVFTINDSGNSAMVYRVDASGATVATYPLKGATNIDWEDLATGTDAHGRHVLYVADIGDNSSKRKEISVYRIAEPSGASKDVTWVRYRFSYPDGPHDAEALLVDPTTQRIYIATKSMLSSGELFAASTSLSSTSLNGLSRVRAVPAMTTSGDFSPDGNQIVLLTYLAAYRADGITAPLQRFSVPLQKQNESIAFVPNGDAVLVGSEGAHSAVYRVTLPPSPTAQTSAPIPQSPSSSVSGPAPRASSDFAVGPAVASATGSATPAPGPLRPSRGSSASRIAGFLVFIVVVAVAVGGARLARRGRRKRMGWPQSDDKPPAPRRPR
jgi:hypothetical protein